MLGSTTDAEDATSEVFLRLQGALREYDTTVPLQAYALTIARRHCIDRLRHENVKQRVLQAPYDETEAADQATPSPLDAVLLAERRTLLHDALRGMSERSRRVLVLRYLCELSYDEIGDAMGLGRNHVAVLVLRAKVELRGAVEAAMKEASR
jgi:RNA polymerase sigma-70 factor, ECF subfamily